MNDPTHCYCCGKSVEIELARLVAAGSARALFTLCAWCEWMVSKRRPE